MAGAERVEYRIKVHMPGEPAQWVISDAEGFDYHPSREMATVYTDLCMAVGDMDWISSDFPDGTLSIVEEGWIGDWFSVKPTDRDFWRYREE